MILALRLAPGQSAWTRKMPPAVDSRVEFPPEQNFISVQRRRAREVRGWLLFDQKIFSSSFSVSTGIRFTTLSDSSTVSSQAQSSSSSSPPRGPPSQPPTTITALFNPMMGHLSAAYVAKVSRDLSLCSRFDFNVYSYDSEWTMGAEWWMRRALSQPILDTNDVQSPDNDTSYPQQGSLLSRSDIRGVVKTRISTNNVRCTRSSCCYCTAQHPVDGFIVMGRTSEANVSQLRCCFGPFKPVETHQSHRTRTVVF